MDKKSRVVCRSLGSPDFQKKYFKKCRARPRPRYDAGRDVGVRVLEQLVAADVQVALEHTDLEVVVDVFIDRFKIGSVEGAERFNSPLLLLLLFLTGVMS